MDDGKPSDKDVELWEEEGKLRCSDPEFGLILAEYVKDLQDPPRKTEQAIALVKRNGQRTSLSTTGRTAGQGGNIISRWRGRQDRTYIAEGGKEVPNAFGASEEANRRGFRTEIVDSGRTEDLAWAHVRVIDPVKGLYREAKVTHSYRAFRLLRAWEYAASQAKYWKGPEPLIIDRAEDDMPVLNPKAMIKGKPAPLWLILRIMQAWEFADRDAETKAERRAQLKLMSQEWREDEEEIELEDAESEAVAEA
jgi:hypothetical protein